MNTHIDAGWRITEDKDGLFHFVGDLEAFKEASGLMTGKEWYGRFEEELMGDTDGYDEDAEESYLFQTSVLEAAKKASGIK